MPGIFFFDLDNTLVDHRTLAMPDSALRAIDALKDAGHTVVVATGRAYGHARPFIERLAPDYAITQNGARILHAGREVMSVTLERAALLDLFAWIRSLGHHYGVNGDTFGYVSAAVEAVTVPLASVEMPYRTDDPFHLDRDVHQAWLFFDEALDPTLIPAIGARYPQFDTVRWHRSGLDVMPHAVNKWTGCQWVLARAGFRAEQAVAFGDGLNDIEMLQGVGLGIAMDNGHPALKAVADRVAPPLHLDGIARMLGEITDLPTARH